MGIGDGQQPMDGQHLQHGLPEYAGQDLQLVVNASNANGCSMMATIWNAIKPVSGPAARRLVMMFTLVLAVARLGAAEWLAPGAYPAITILSQRLYGVVFGLLFVGMLVTQGVHRVSLAGFIVSVVGAGAYVMLAVDVWPVVATAGYYALMGVTLMAEAAVIWRALCAKRAL